MGVNRACKAADSLEIAFEPLLELACRWGKAPLRYVGAGVELGLISAVFPRPTPSRWGSVTKVSLSKVRCVDYERSISPVSLLRLGRCRLVVLVIAAPWGEIGCRRRPSGERMSRMPISSTA